MKTITGIHCKQRWKDSKSVRSKVLCVKLSN